MRFEFAWLALAAFAAGPPLANAASACPASVVHVQRLTGIIPFSTDAFVYDSSFTPAADARITFDRTQARLTLSASSGGRMTSWVRVVELFDVTGVLPGTPVDGMLILRLDGWSEQSCGGSGCGIRFEGTMVVGLDSVMADANHVGPTTGRHTLAATLSLPVHFIAGTPIEAQFFLDYGTGPGAGGAHAEGTGTWGVMGLPNGVSAIACPGNNVMPVRRSSWGRLKSLYR